jgi:hypothetical protein
LKLAVWSLSCGLLAAAPAAALSSGRLPLVEPSAIGAVPLAGSVVLDVEAIPPAQPALLSLVEVAATSGALAIALDPTLASPGLGVVQPDGSFVIPTLFLRIQDGAAQFDLAIPNVTGTMEFGASGEVLALDSSFAIETEAGDVTVVIAAVPEPGPAARAAALLLGLGLAARASRGRAEGMR